jgi:NAD(P)-dependent dehydrogenase (short-subunit alcohol dehydrogenase family)
MDFTNTVAVVTGGNRGLGREFVRLLVDRGAKVYAAARKPETVDVPDAIPLRMDVTTPDTISAAAHTAGDATLLINNAGISTHTPLTNGDIGTIRLEMETNFFGPLAAVRAFAPVIEANGGGQVLNVLSVLSWRHPSNYGAYSAAKAAAWALTDVAREELDPKGIKVTSLHVGYMDTDMASYVPPEGKTDPAVVAAIALDGLAAGKPEIIADDFTREVKAGLSTALSA